MKSAGSRENPGALFCLAEELVAQATAEALAGFRETSSL
jgi:hypothetical protein